MPTPLDIINLAGITAATLGLLSVVAWVCRGWQELKIKDQTDEAIRNIARRSLDTRHDPRLPLPRNGRWCRSAGVGDRAPRC